MRTEDQQIFDQIKKAHNILITTKESYSGDALTSALGLFLFIKKLDKKVTVAINNFNHAGRNFSFLPNIKDIESSLSATQKFIISLDTAQTGVEDISYQINGQTLEFIITPKEGAFAKENISTSSMGASYDLIITLSCPDLHSLGAIYNHNTAFFYATPIINIDHDPDNEAFGQINKIDITALSTTELLYGLWQEYNNKLINPDIATCLLTGMIAESKSFKVGALTPKSLQIASELVALGADRETIVRNLYQSRTLNTLKLWGRVLAKIKDDMGGRLVWSALAAHDFEKTASTPNDLENVVEELVVTMPQALVIIIFAENKNATLVNIYTTKNIDALMLAKQFSATGSKDSATFLITKTLAETEKTVIDQVKATLAKLPI